MNGYVFWGIGIGSFVLQLAICFCSSRVWVRLIPGLVLALLAGGCFAFYAASDFLSWGWLLLLICPVQAVAGVIGAWLVFGLFRLVKKVCKTSGV